MRSAGIDVAKSGISAVALAIDGVPSRWSIWKPENKNDTPAVQLIQFDEWLARQLFIMNADVIAVEELAVFMNKTVIRALARVEGVALLRAKKTGAMVVSPGVSQSRKIVWGKGNLSKDECWKLFRNRYYEFEVPKKTVGGTDVMDAMTHALAAPTVLERR